MYRIESELPNVVGDSKEVCWVNTVRIREFGMDDLWNGLQIVGLLYV